MNTLKTFQQVDCQEVISPILIIKIALYNTRLNYKFNNFQQNEEISIIVKQHLELTKQTIKICRRYFPSL